jgi:phosphatidate cytidylyltransferase
VTELRTRILVAVPAAIIFITLTWFGGTPFYVLMGLITLLTIYEVNRMFSLMVYPAYNIIAFFVGAAVWSFVYLPELFQQIVAALIVFSIIFAVVTSAKRISSRWLSTLFAGIYAPLGLFMIVMIRETGSDVDGFWLTLTLLLMIWGNDVFAYFGGRKFGKRPLAPKISPKKTWEGFWSGFLGATTGLLITYFIAGLYPVTLLQALPLVLIVSVMGPLGDLTASRIKRIAGVKDSSAMLPGHGGFFDRFDSLILTAPFFWLYLNFFI